jgi:phospholipase C
VANLVDAIGDSACKDSNGHSYCQDTAIFITWDDWGGWYDHVPPPAVYRSSSSTSCPPTVVPNGTAPLRPLAGVAFEITP